MYRGIGSATSTGRAYCKQVGDKIGVPTTYDESTGNCWVLGYVFDPDVIPAGGVPDVPIPQFFKDRLPPMPGDEVIPAEPPTPAPPGPGSVPGGMPLPADFPPVGSPCNAKYPPIAPGAMSPFCQLLPGTSIPTPTVPSPPTPAPPTPAPPTQTPPVEEKSEKENELPEWVVPAAAAAGIVGLFLILKK